MNRAARRRATKNARRTATECPWCHLSAPVEVEVCMDGCCPTRQSCAACGCPR
jgi:hypothetical protein